MISLPVVEEVIVISRVPLNCTPLIVLAYSNCVARSANPCISPLINIEVDSVIPAVRFENPTIPFEGSIVNATSDAIATTVPLIVNKITGRSRCVESINEVARGRVMPKPSTASGPINVQLLPSYRYSWLTGVFNQIDPAVGLGGSVSDTSVLTGCHLTPS